MRRGVRKAAVQMLSSAAHSKASLVSGQLPAVLPQLFQQTAIDVGLIRTVDLGPFKHKIDDGLELRKAAFECMDVLLDACADRLDYQAFLEHLESGLKVQSCHACHVLMSTFAVRRMVDVADGSVHVQTSLLPGHQLYWQG